MARIPQISSIANLHGETARAGGFAITGTIGTADAAGIAMIKTITPKTITKR
ncbi:hypothetical protein [Trinickia fusca]|uniref:hypothetical protein n=1 Tax=Trinickia fusca TaxID=2419777 RepID=UPI001602A7D2|nr:hypothetical protein [Trinickia fusca]